MTANPQTHQGGFYATGELQEMRSNGAASKGPVSVVDKVTDASKVGEEMQTCNKPQHREQRVLNGRPKRPRQTNYKSQYCKHSQ